MAKLHWKVYSLVIFTIILCFEPNAALFFLFLLRSKAIHGLLLKIKGFLPRMYEIFTECKRGVSKMKRKVSIGLNNV